MVAIVRSLMDTLKDGLHPTAFGQVTHGGVTDCHAAFQACIDEAIAIHKAGYGVPRINLPPGNFALSEPLRILKHSAGAFSIVSLNMEGQGQGYIGNQRTQFVIQDETVPAICIQNAKGVRLANFTVKGQANALVLPTYLQMLRDTSSPWWNGGAAQDIASAPHCGIAIDPFKSGVPADGGYAALSSYYTQNANSTLVTIDGVSAQGFIAGMAASTGGTSNGDHLTFRDCDTSYNKISYVFGQSQNRSTVINPRWVANQTFIDCMRYGNSTSPFPSVFGGIGGYVKWLVMGNPGYGEGIITGLFMESLWGLGFWGDGSGTMPLTFNGCMFKIIDPSAHALPALDAHLVAGGPVCFNGGFIGPALNLNRRLRVYVSAASEVRFTGGACLDGTPTVYPNRETIDGAFVSGTYMTKPNYRVATLSDLGQFMRVAPGAIIEEGQNATYRRYKAINGWETISVGTATITVDGSDGTATFTAADPTILTVGDHLSTTTDWFGEGPFGIPTSYSFDNLGIGRISVISGSDITLVDVPTSLTTGSYAINLVYLPRIFPRTFGTLTSGSPTIASVSQITGWQVNVGVPIKGTAGIAAGTRVTAASGTTITMSKNATASGVVEIYDGRLILDLGYATAAPGSGTGIKGDFLTNSAPALDTDGKIVSGWLCTVTGSPGTWTAIEASDGGPITQDAYRVDSGNINAQTGTTYTLVAADNGKVVTCNNAAAITVTVPSGLGAGFYCTVMQLGAGQVTFATSSTTINPSATLKIAAQHGRASLYAYAANTFNISGNISA